MKLRHCGWSGYLQIRWPAYIQIIQFLSWEERTTSTRRLQMRIILKLNRQLASEGCTKMEDEGWNLVSLYLFQVVKYLVFSWSRSCFSFNLNWRG